jgi:hypothetical protein
LGKGKKKTAKETKIKLGLVNSSIFNKAKLKDPKKKTPWGGEESPFPKNKSKEAP